MQHKVTVVVYRRFNKRWNSQENLWIVHKTCNIWNQTQPTLVHLAYCYRVQMTECDNYNRKYSFLQQVLSYKYQYQYQWSKYQYLTCKYQYPNTVLKYRSSTSTSTKYNKTVLFKISESTAEFLYLFPHFAHICLMVNIVTCVHILCNSYNQYIII